MTIQFLLFPTHVNAAKAKLKKAVVTNKSKVAFPLAVSTKVRRDKKAVTITFGNLSGVKRIFYTLSYNTNASTEGAVETIVPKKSAKSVSKLIPFGTCSSGVCRYHSGISNVVLEVSATTKKGISTKTYRVRL